MTPNDVSSILAQAMKTPFGLYHTVGSQVQTFMGATEGLVLLARGGCEFAIRDGALGFPLRAIAMAGPVRSHAGQAGSER